MSVVTDPRPAVLPKPVDTGLPPELQALINRVNHQLEGRKRKQRLERENRDFLFGRFIFE